MFAGNVEAVDVIATRTQRLDALRLTIWCQPGACHPVCVGDVVAVAGVKMAIARLVGRSAFVVEVPCDRVVGSTLRTAEIGERVNLEPSVLQHRRAAEHLLQGCVEGTATLDVRIERGRSAVLRFAVPQPAGLVTPGGPVAVDGTSLMVSEVGEEGRTMTVRLSAPCVHRAEAVAPRSVVNRAPTSPPSPNAAAATASG